MTKPDQLYELLPVIYRQRDEAHGIPLKALLRVIGEQARVVEEDIARLYENWFIETCDDWVVPYIADLVGFEPVSEAGQPGAIETRQGRLRNKILVPRREVANTIRNRRRKGTLPLLELLANDVAGWPARAVEFFRLLGLTQNINHLRMEQGRTVDLRNGLALGRLNGPFEEIAHTIDVRRPNSHRTPGRYNIPSVGLFVWRLRVYSMTHAPTSCMEEVDEHFFTFSIIGNDAPLFIKWEPEDEATQIASELNLPARLTRRAFEANLAAYYGEDKSLFIWEDGFDSPVLIERIVVADLSDWHYSPKAGQVAVDPELGRIAFPKAEPKRDNVWANYQYGFAMDLGGGEYERPIFQPTIFMAPAQQLTAHEILAPDQLAAKLRQSSDAVAAHVCNCLSSSTQSALARGESVTPALIADLNHLLHHDHLAEAPGMAEKFSDKAKALLAQNPAGAELVHLNRMALEQAFADEIAPYYRRYQVGKTVPAGFDSLNKALDKWVEEKPSVAIIEILDNAVYEERIAITFGANDRKDQNLHVRAANGKRPAIRSADWRAGAPDAITITGGPESMGRLTLDGLLIYGRGISVEGEMEEINIRHCTLVPGWDMDPDCEPKRPNETSLELLNTNARVRIESSILGTIEVRQDAIDTDPITIHLSDSILDSTDDKLEALSDEQCGVAHVLATFERCTVIGKILTHAIPLAENCIFMSTIQVARRQIGCIRFCYVTPGSRTPRRFNCQPDLAEKPIREAFRLGQINAPQRDAEIAAAQLRMRPEFMEARYGKPDYCRLTDFTAEEIKRGADDESEMGVYHDLFNPQREANLRTRLEEYTPAGMHAGIFFAS